MRTYAIGDIHGHLDLLRAAHRLIAADQSQSPAPGAPVVHLGDLVDRGPDSAGVIDWLVAGPVAGAGPWITLRGNHDFLFRLFMTDPTLKDPGLRSDLDWLHARLGGVETLQSYGVADPGTRPIADVHAEALARVPAAHLRFLDSLPFYALRDGAFFVHAGIRPGVPLTEQAETDMMWIRKPFHDSNADHGALIVHGHTPVEEPTHYGNRVNIDTGAAYGGPLTTIVIEDGRVWHLTEVGRVEI